MTDWNDRSEIISRFDLLAFADGALDDDPERKAAVERWLQRNTDDRARVEAFAEQARALRARYGGRVGEPVPEHLYAALSPPSARAWPPRARAAGFALLVGSAMAFGWLLGQQGESSRWTAEILQEESLRNLAGLPDVGDPVASSTPDVSRAVAPQWLSTDLALMLQMPDLHAQGFVLVDQETVIVGRRQILRLTYVDAAGRGFSLFVRPRWENQAGDIEVKEKGDLSLAHWVDGPAGWAVVARGSSQEALALAEAVRSAIADQRKRSPEVVAPGPAPAAQNQGSFAGSLVQEAAGGDGLAVDTLGVPESPPQPTENPRKN